MPHMISVQPAETGWIVTSSVGYGPTVFERGGEAEAAARRLGEQLSTCGHPVQINVRLKNGQMACLNCPPGQRGAPTLPEITWPTQAEVFS